MCTLVGEHLQLGAFLRQRFKRLDRFLEILGKRLCISCCQFAFDRGNLGLNFRLCRLRVIVQYIQSDHEQPARLFPILLFNRFGIHRVLQLGEIFQAAIQLLGLQNCRWILHCRNIGGVFRRGFGPRRRFGFRRSRYHGHIGINQLSDGAQLALNTRQFCRVIAGEIRFFLFRGRGHCKLNGFNAVAFASLASRFKAIAFGTSARWFRAIAFSLRLRRAGATCFSKLQFFLFFIVACGLLRGGAVCFCKLQLFLFFFISGSFRRCGRSRTARFGHLEFFLLLIIGCGFGRSGRGGTARFGHLEFFLFLVICCRF